MDKVKIGWREYEIQYNDIVDSEDDLGFISHAEGVIRIKHGPVEGVTLLHEILHGINKYIGGISEALIEAISMNLWGVLKDNPELLDYIKKECGEKK